jgi:protein-S-isoprenylcysteine O-methyltransferase Ste14
MAHRFGLLWRAIGAFLALPVVVAFGIPWMLNPPVGRPQTVGIVLWIVGAFLLLWCVRDFFVVGRGTLAPWAPPEKLVTDGLYRVSRNPMYVAVSIILCGWAVAFGSPILWVYAVAMAVAFHFRVVRHEEPLLAETHGDAWLSYQARIPRWLGRRKANGS